MSQICINIKTLKGFKKYKEESTNLGLLNTKTLSYSEKPLKPALLQGAMVCGGTKMFLCSYFGISYQSSVKCIGLEEPLNPFLILAEIDLLL